MRYHHRSVGLVAVALVCLTYGLLCRATPPSAGVSSASSTADLAAPTPPQDTQRSGDDRALRRRGGGGAELSLLAGVIQPVVLRGGNVEVDVHWKRLVVGYSHGFLLHLDGATVVGDAADQGLSYKLPFSTGLGIGVRLTDFFDVRAEFKAHRFNVHYDDAANEKLFGYTTYTVGVGAYLRWRPLRSARDWTRGIITSSSLRFWPNVASTLDNGERVYDNRITDKRERHEAANIGIANTPVIVNISVGYMLDL